MLYIVALAIVLSASAIAAPAAPQWRDRKCLPKQYEAVGLGKVSQVNKNERMVFDVVKLYAVDFEIGKEVSILSVHFEEKLIGYYFYLRDGKFDYFVEVFAIKCTKLPATKLEHLCTDSPNMYYMTSMSVGDQMTDTYVSMLGGSKHTGTFLRSSFTLISEVVEQTLLGFPQMLAFQMGNYTMGVKDPGVFDVPSYC